MNDRTLILVFGIITMLMILPGYCVVLLMQKFWKWLIPKLIKFL